MKKQTPYHIVPVSVFEVTLTSKNSNDVLSGRFLCHYSFMASRAENCFIELEQGINIILDKNVSLPDYLIFDVSGKTELFLGIGEIPSYKEIGHRELNIYDVKIKFINKGNVATIAFENEDIFMEDFITNTEDIDVISKNQGFIFDEYIPTIKG